MGLASERRGRRPRRAGDSAPLAQLPWKQPRRGFPPVRLLSDDQIETIHRAALDLLEDIGMDILYPQARQILADAGAIVAGERVRIGRDIIEAAIGTAPEEFTFHARNPSRSIRIGGDWIAFAPVGGPPNCRTPIMAGAPAPSRTMPTSSGWRSISTASTPPGAGRPMRSTFMPRCGISASA